VTVTSAFGEPVQGGVVTFTAPSSGASTSPAVNTATIGSSGQASVSVTANSVAGGYTVTASASGVATPAQFSLTNTAAPANNVPLGGTDSQSHEVLGNVADGAGMTSADLDLHDTALAQWDSQPEDVGFSPARAHSRPRRRWLGQ
jgi:hypothetical protein